MERDAEFRCLAHKPFSGVDSKLGPCGGVADLRKELGLYRPAVKTEAPGGFLKVMSLPIKDRAIPLQQLIGR